jgi:Tol biopolymer transport system component
VRRSLAPYAISAALVFVVSIAVLAAALATGGLLEERVRADASPTPSTGRTAIELSRTGRLAYWRTDPTNGNQLWVSNVDGSQRRAIAKIDGLSRVQATRWSPDGNAVAYLDRGQSIVVQRLDGAGAQFDLALPQLVVAGNARIIDFDWSTDSASLAATVRGSSSGTPNAETDVWVVSAAGGDWRNVTSLGNAFLSQWLAPDELLVHTQNGLIAVAAWASSGQGPDGARLRPLTAQVATSPFLGDDGRIYYLAGQVAPTIRDATVPVMNAGQARVWSTTRDGDDLRPETTRLYDDLRLVTRWPNGPFVAHPGASTALVFLGDSSQPIDTTIGVVDRVVFSPDRRAAIGFSGTRIFRYDTARPDQPVVLLSDVVQPDAWYPRPVAVPRSSPPRPHVGPAARYVFVFAGLIWATDSTGEVRRLRQLQANDRDLDRLGGVAIPQWSPRGDRVLYFDLSRNRGLVFVSDLTGTGGRLSDLDAAGPFPTWSPDGNAAYTTFIGSPDSTGFGDDGTVFIVTPTNGARVASYRAREIAFGGGKTYLIDNGKLNPSFGPRGTRTDHAILESTPIGSRTVTTAAALSAGTPFSAVPALQLAMLGASADGLFLSARLSPAAGSLGFVFTLLSAADGGPTLQMPGQDVADIRWAPSGHLVGMTLANIPVVRDAETGVIVASATSGRFAGWSPDGKWFYVARETGLYAQLLAGGDPVRISSFGVPVSTTTP